MTGVCGATHAVLHKHRAHVAQALGVLAQPEAPGEGPTDPSGLMWPLVELADVFVAQVYGDVEATLVHACADPLLHAKEGQGAALGTAATADRADKVRPRRGIISTYDDLIATLRCAFALCVVSVMARARHEACSRD